MTTPESLAALARTFDEQIRERVRHGHIPDLRRVEPCDWFYNNPWRRPDMVDAVFGEMFRFASAHIPAGARVLEVGSGPGHMALEFARTGRHVIGIELSPACVEVAERTARDNPFRETFGGLEYVCADFLAWQPPPVPFDAVCFFGTLILFSDPHLVLAKVTRLLRPGGVLVAAEPVLEWMRESDAAVVALVRLLLATSGRWYERLPLPATQETVRDAVEAVLAEFRELRSPSEAARFPETARADELLALLRDGLDELEYRLGYAFLPRVIGGVRGVTDADVQALARFLQAFDRVAVASGWLRPTGFYWAGRRR